jgi:hypothetical protein
VRSRASHRGGRLARGAPAGGRPPRRPRGTLPGRRRPRGTDELRLAHHRCRGRRRVHPGRPAGALRDPRRGRLPRGPRRAPVPRSRVPGYEGEPYVRIAPDGTVEVNQRSRRGGSNDERYETDPNAVDAPADMAVDAPPRWEVVGSDGAFAWHDHRIHWMSPALPGQVDPSARDPAAGVRLGGAVRGRRRGGPHPRRAGLVPGTRAGGPRRAGRGRGPRGRRPGGGPSRRLVAARSPSLRSSLVRSG